LPTGVKRGRVGALVFALVVACGGAGNGCSAVGVAKRVGVCAAVAGVGSIGIDGVCGVAVAGVVVAAGVGTRRCRCGRYRY